MKAECRKGSVLLFSNIEWNVFWIIRSRKLLFYMMKINNLYCEQTDMPRLNETTDLMMLKLCFDGS